MTSITVDERGTSLTDTAELRRHVEEVVNRTPVVDVHTHLFAPEFGELNLFGIDQLLNYHYLIAETFRSSKVTPERFWLMNKAQQADLIWKTLFVDHTPVSEAARGIVTVLSTLGLDPCAPDLSEARGFFRTQKISDHIDRVLETSSVSEIVMTNDPFDEQEERVWESGQPLDDRFHASLRIDPLLNNWEDAAPKLAARGYRVDANLTGASAAEARRFLDKCIARIEPMYMAVSLPDSFRYPAADARDRLIREVILPTAKEHKLAFTLMVGVRRGVNPALRSAGDGVGYSDITALERLCAENPQVKFLATYLSRENQHALCVVARKFSNLMPFGCWWFLNNPSIV